jgi:hypothetical protein
MQPPKQLAVLSAGIGDLAHMPSGRFGANSAWILCAAIAHNLLHATAVLAGGTHAVPRGHPAAQDRQRRRPTGAASTPTDSAPTQSLALAASLAYPVAQHHRIKSTNNSDHLIIRREARDGTTGKTGQTSRYPLPKTCSVRNFSRHTPQRSQSTDPGLAKRSAVLEAE